MQKLLLGSDVGEVSLQATQDLWAGRLGDEPLTQARLRRWFDIDSVYMEAESLTAIRKEPVLCMLPTFTAAVSQNAHRPLSGNVLIQDCKNLRLFKAGPHTIELVFPHMITKRGTGQAAQTNALKDDVLKEFMDDHLLPALRGSLPGVIMQGLPNSFDAAMAAANTSLAKLQGGYSDPDSAGRQRTMLQYDIPASSLGALWEALSTSLNEPTCKFRGAKLLLQGHELKARTHAEDVAHMLERAQQNVFDYIHFPSINQRHCWVDFGIRDAPEVPHPQADAVTLLYRPACLGHLHARGQDNPWTGFQPRTYCQYLLRDAGSLELVRDTPVRDDPGSLYVRQLKSYNSHKNAFFAPDKQHHPFAQDRFPRLVLNDELQGRWEKAQSGKTGSYSDPTAALTSWEVQQAAIWHQLKASSTMSYGGRREIIINLPALLQILDRQYLDDDPGLFLHVRYMFRSAHSDPTRPGEGQHLPFLVVPTADLNDLIRANCSRFVVAVNHMVAQTRPAGQSRQLPEQPTETTQLSMMKLNLVLARLLVASCSSVILSRDQYIYLDEWQPRRGREAPEADPPPKERGLGLGHIITTRGTVHFEAHHLELTLPRFSPETESLVAWPPAYRIQSGDSAASKAATNFEIVAFKTYVSQRLTDLYERAHEASPRQPLSAPASLQSIATAFLIEMEAVVTSYNRYLLRTLNRSIAKLFNLRVKDVREHVLKPIGLHPTHRASSRILSLSDIDRLYIKTYEYVGLDKLCDLFQKQPAHLRLDMPLVSKTRKAPPPTWSEFVTSALSGLSVGPDPAKPSWKGADFVRRWHEADDRWKKFCYAHQDTSGLHLWRRYSEIYAGRFVSVLPNFDKTKFFSVQSSAAKREAGPKLFKAKWCIPGIQGDRLNPDGKDRIAILMRRARLYSAIAMTQLPEWLGPYIDQGINVEPGDESRFPSPSASSMRTTATDLDRGEAPNGQPPFRPPPTVLQHAASQLIFESATLKPARLKYRLSSAAAPLDSDATAIENITTQRSERYREPLKLFGTNAQVAYSCMWVFTSLDVLEDVDHTPLRNLLYKIGWTRCADIDDPRDNSFQFFSDFQRHNMGLPPALHQLTDLLDLHVSRQNQAEEAVAEAALEAEMEQEENEDFPAVVDM